MPPDPKSTSSAPIASAMAIGSTRSAPIAACMVNGGMSQTTSEATAPNTVQPRWALS